MPTERFLDSCIAEHDRYGGGSVMVWGGCWNEGKTGAVVVQGNLNGQRYVDDIVIPVIAPAIAERNLTLQQDNAKPHTCRVTMNAFAANNIPRLHWPARSPDLSPIEHVWDIMQRDLLENYAVPTSLQQLAEQVVHAWTSVSQAAIQNLIASMPRRIEECIERGGGHTHY